ncbi:hypothetical protein E2C01_029467 [Portunus trituberculatus]|uniref:Uncharacterized protein n=1 Tax=Portunus trituberculatus TaxID=210409 RepID=A0A5B7ET01_PORTR|nr:hypothetical protein [Portunus trituberculatus]
MQTVYWLYRRLKQRPSNQSQEPQEREESSAGVNILRDGISPSQALHATTTCPPPPVYILTPPSPQAILATPTTPAPFPATQPPPAIEVRSLLYTRARHCGKSHL